MRASGRRASRSQWIAPRLPAAPAGPARIPPGAECRAPPRPGAPGKGRPRQRHSGGAAERCQQQTLGQQVGGPGGRVPRPARRAWRTRARAHCREPAAGWRHWRRQSAETIRPRRSTPPARGARCRSRFPPAAAPAPRCSGWNPDRPRPVERPQRRDFSARRPSSCAPSSRARMRSPRLPRFAICTGLGTNGTHMESAGERRMLVCVPMEGVRNSAGITPTIS